MARRTRKFSEVKLSVYFDNSVESRALEIALENAEIKFIKLSGGVIPNSDDFPREVPALSTAYGSVEGFSNIRRYFDIPNLDKILGELQKKNCPTCGRDRE